MTRRSRRHARSVTGMPRCSVSRSCVVTRCSPRTSFPVTRAKAWCQSVGSLVMYRPLIASMGPWNHTIRGRQFGGGPRNHVPKFLPGPVRPRFFLRNCCQNCRPATSRCTTKSKQRGGGLNEKAAWLTKYDALKRERDALAEELREVYPDAARAIANLFGRIATNNEALAELHRDRPARVEQQHLRSAELHARGLESFSTPSLLTSVHLFDWDTGHQICPPPRPSMASAFAAVEPPHHSHRFSADWWKDNERRAAAQRVEQQRTADYYARMTKEQEDRENAEARERFLEQQQRLSVNRPPSTSSQRF